MYKRDCAKRALAAFGLAFLVWRSSPSPMLPHGRVFPSPLVGVILGVFVKSAKKCAAFGICAALVDRLGSSSCRLCGVWLAWMAAALRLWRAFSPCGAFIPSGACLLVRMGFRLMLGVFGCLCALFGSFVWLRSLSNAPQWAKFRACCVFFPRCVFSVWCESLPRLWAKFKALAVALRFAFAPWVLRSDYFAAILGAFACRPSVERERESGKAYPLPYYFNARGYAVLLT